MAKSRRMHLVKTEAGNNLVPPTKSVLVRFGDRYIRRQAQHLVPGDRVRWKKEFIQKTLDEVDIELSSRSERYVQARETVMIQGSTGIWVPRLRYHLLAGAPAVTRSQALFEGTDISPGECREITNLVHKEIVDYSRLKGMGPVCWDTVSNWVLGNVLAPANKDFFYPLGGIHPAFYEIHDDFRAGGPWAQAYELYVTLRRVAMNYIAKPKAEGKGTSPGAAKGKGSANGRFAEELSALVEAFETDRESACIDVAVQGNETQRLRNKALSNRKRVDPHLFKGVVCEGDELAVEADSLDNYSDAEICGGAIMDNPREAIENAKKFALEHGFSLAELKERLTPKKIDEKRIKKAVEEASSELGLSVESIRDELLEGSGLKYEELSPEEKAALDGQVAEVARSVASNLQGNVDRIQRFLDLAGELDPEE